MIDMLRQRLKRHAATNAVQEEQALKEMLQELTLYALWRGGFFEVAAFQVGTSLRGAWLLGFGGSEGRRNLS